MTAAVRRFILSPVARTLLRVVLRTWRIDKFDVCSVGAHKFGHLALEPLVGHLESRRRTTRGDNRRVLWTLGPRRTASNPVLHAMWCRNLKVYPRHLLGLAISPRGPRLLPTTIYGTRNVLDSETWRPQLTMSDREAGYRFLRDHGWDGRQPLVGVVINEGLHYGSSWLKHETEIAPDLRVLTFPVHEFEQVVSELARRGVTVVRLGAPPATALTSVEPGVIDYATADTRSAALDVILPGLMSRILSTQSGPDAVAMMFGVPITYIDVARLKYCFFDVATVHWRPAILRSSDGRSLGLQDLLDPEFVDLKTPEDFASRGITVQRASTADRIATAIEGLAIGSGNLVLDDRDRELQASVRRAFLHAQRRGVLSGRGEASAMLSPDFLRTHGDWYLRGL